MAIQRALNAEADGPGDTLFEADLSSRLAALLKKRALWLVGIVPGAIGIVYLANGYWLFF